MDFSFHDPFHAIRTPTDAGRTATLFSVFLGGAVFFNFPLTCQAADYFIIQRIISDMRLIFSIENDTLWQKNIRRT